MSGPRSFGERPPAPARVPLAAVLALVGGAAGLLWFFRDRGGSGGRQGRGPPHRLGHGEAPTGREARRPASSPAGEEAPGPGTPGLTREQQREQQRQQEQRRALRARAAQAAEARAKAGQSRGVGPTVSPAAGRAGDAHPPSQLAESPSEATPQRAPGASASASASASPSVSASARASGEAAPLNSSSSSAGGGSLESRATGAVTYVRGVLPASGEQGEVLSLSSQAGSDWPYGGSVGAAPLTPYGEILLLCKQIDALQEQARSLLRSRADASGDDSPSSAMPDSGQVGGSAVSGAAAAEWEQRRGQLLTELDAACSRLESIEHTESVAPVRKQQRARLQHLHTLVTNASMGDCPPEHVLARTFSRT